MEPALPAPPERLLDPEELAEALLVAEIADGALPRFHAEQRPAKSAAALRAESVAAQIERGRQAEEKRARGGTLGTEELADWCAYFDPSQAGIRRRKPRS
jgi:hypothetical protein